MSDWIEHDGKKYYEESYIVLANRLAKCAMKQPLHWRQFKRGGLYHWSCLVDMRTGHLAPVYRTACGRDVKSWMSDESLIRLTTERGCAACKDANKRSSEVE